MFNFEDNIGLVVLKMIASKKTLFVKEVFKSDNMEQGYGTKCSILKITCSCMYSKQLSGKNLPPACEWLLQIWPLGTELWDKTFNFEDNIGLLVPKRLSGKHNPCL